MTAIPLLIVLLGVVLPACYVAAALPALWALQNLIPAEVATIASAGPVHLSIVDVVLVVLLAKWLVTVVAKKEITIDGPLFAAIAVYLGVNFIATLAAGAKFGAGQMAPCMTSLARFSLEIAVVPILAQAVTTVPQAKRCTAIVLGTLVALAVIQFVNFLGAGHGFAIGEMQGAERGEVRYFGPLGDSVGVVLLLGYIVSLCFASLAGTCLFLGGIALTAGLGAVLAAGVGTLLFVLVGGRDAAARMSGRQTVWLLPVLAFAGIVAAAVAAKPLGQTLLDRFGRGDVASSAVQRSTSADLALAMVRDNPLLGVGYMGFQPALEHYGGDRFFDLAQSDGATANANNQVLQALTDGGIAGLLAWSGLIFFSARLLLIVARRSAEPFVGTFYLAAFIWLLAQCFGNISAVWLTPSAHVGRLLWILLGTAIALQRFLPVAADEPLARGQVTLVRA